jgi:hypothetical protein
MFEIIKNINIKSIVSVLITVFLILMVLNHFFKGFFKLNPFYRNKISLEGFDDSENDVLGNDVSGNNASGNDASGNDASGNDASGNDASGNDASGNDASVDTKAPSAQPPGPPPPGPSSGPEIPDTEKSTIMVELFEKVNTQMDIIRTIKLSDRLVPINIDKTASEPFTILMNLKLLINNGIYKNEMDLKEMYDKYIGNKAIQVLTSDINSVNMESSADVNIGSLESSFLTRCQSIVGAHQTVIDKLLENQSKN